MPVTREQAEEAARRAKAKQQQQQQTKPNGSSPPIIKVKDVAPKPVRWTWHPYLPAGQISILGGPGGAGKGLVATDITSRITNGCLWPESTNTSPQGLVLWCETEDPLAEVIKPRLIAAGANCDFVWFCKPDGFMAPDLAAMIKNDRLRLIVMSPMFSFLRGLTGINDELAVRGVLEQLQSTIEGSECLVLGIAHTNKKPDLRAIERLLGTVAFTNFCRSVLLVSRDREDEDWFRLVHAKHNLSVRGDDLLYKPRHVGRDDPRDQYVRLDWERPENGNYEADSLYDRKTKGNGHAERMSANEWLVGYLQQHGESLRADIVIAGERAGFKEPALKAAQQRNPRIVSRQEGFQGPYLWRLA
jgi:AAA domain